LYFLGYFQEHPNGSLARLKFHAECKILNPKIKQGLAPRYLGFGIWNLSFLVDTKERLSDPRQQAD
jgi:hypothetical protein